MDFNSLFPMGKKKACTFSYDDGQISDRKLVEILNYYQMKATFHLNSGTLGTKGFVQRQEIVELYAGHEIACHGEKHLDFTQLSKTRLMIEILEDKRSLELLANYLIRGMSYPFGLHTEEVENMARNLGIEYSRTVESTYRFDFPADFLRWHPTCHHNEAKKELLDEFLTLPEYKKLPVLIIWGHSFEFDRENNWNQIEEIGRILSGREEIWYATNLQIKDYISAMQQLVSSVDKSMLYNPTGQTLWVEKEETILRMEPGKIIYL